MQDWKSALNCNEKNTIKATQSVCNFHDALGTWNKRLCVWQKQCLENCSDHKLKTIVVEKMCVFLLLLRIKYNQQPQLAECVFSR